MFHDTQVDLKISGNPDTGLSRAAGDDLFDDGKVNKSLNYTLNIVSGTHQVYVTDSLAEAAHAAGSDEVFQSGHVFEQVSNFIYNRQSLADGNTLVFTAHRLY